MFTNPERKASSHGSASGSDSIDAFAGAGGMTLGFSKSFGHAFDSVWANDFDECCVDTYNANLGKHCVPGDIVDILNDPATHIPKADVVIGGPPCQGFSLLDRIAKVTRANSFGGPTSNLFSGRERRSSLWRMCLSSSARLSMARLWVWPRRWAFEVWGHVLCAATTEYLRHAAGHLSLAVSFLTRSFYFHLAKHISVP